MATNEEKPVFRKSQTGKDKYVAPNMPRRKLIFDSLSKLGKGEGSKPSDGARGTLLYTWGAGYHGQLGQSTYRKKCQRLPSLLDFDMPVVQVACGGFHNALLTECGKVYTWGDGRKGQLGNLARKHNMLSTPHIVEHNLSICKISVAQVACGQYHTACVTTSGDLYTWGLGKFGQLGNGSRLDSRYPSMVNVDALSQRLKAGTRPRFKMVSCGDRHTCAITRDNMGSKLVTFGSGQHGQLGHPNPPNLNERIDYLQPKVVEVLDEHVVLTVDAGATHTAAITENGAVWIWGFGESLHPKEFSNIVETPRQVKLNQPAKQVVCGQSHVLILTISGDVYSFGGASMGQLGHGAETNVRNTRLVLAGKNIFQVAVGRYHSMAVTVSGVVFSWGCGESGQLAHDTLDNELFPRPVASILANVVGQISCGEHHSFCLSSIEHNEVSRDVREWLAVEEEELKLKKQLAKDRTNGLKSKDVLNMLEERQRIVAKFKEEKVKDKEVEDRYLKEQIGSIRTWEALQAEVAESFAFNSDATNKLKERGSAPFTVDKDGLVTVRPPTTIARPVQDERAATQPLKRTGVQPLRKPMRKPGSMDFSPRQDPLARSLTPVESVPDLRASKKNVKKPLKRMRAGQRPRTSGGLAHSASAPALNGKIRPGSAGTKAMTTFQPLQPRMAFMERTTNTLGKLKRFLSSGEQAQGQTGKPRARRQADVFALKKRYNHLLSLKKKKGDELVELRNSLHYLKPTDEDKRDYSVNDTRIKDLTMKLATLSTNLRESHENRKNYELYIIRMKEEDVQLSKQIDHLRQLVTEYDRLLTKMSRMNKKVSSQKTDLDDEIIRFHEDIVGFSDFADMQLGKYKGIVETNMQARNRAEKTEEQKRSLKEKAQRTQRQQIENETKREEAAEVKDELIGWMGKVEYYEKRFHKITAATGVSKPEDIVNKFFFNDEITEDLQQDIMHRKTKIAKLEKEAKATRGALKAAKDGFQVSKWSEVGTLKAKFDDSQSRHSKEKSDANRLLKQISFVQEGTEQITHLLEETLGDLPEELRGEMEEHQAGDANESVWWTKALEKRIDHLLAVVRIEEEATDPNADENNPERTEALSNFAAAGFLRAGASNRKWVDDEDGYDVADDYED